MIIRARLRLSNFTLTKRVGVNTKVNFLTLRRLKFSKCYKLLWSLSVLTTHSFPIVSIFPTQSLPTSLFRAGLLFIWIHICSVSALGRPLRRFLSSCFTVPITCSTPIGFLWRRLCCGGSLRGPVGTLRRRPCVTRLRDLLCIFLCIMNVL